MRVCSINCCLATVAILAVTFVAGGASQQPGPPKPAAEMSQLASMDGSWTCDGKSFESPMGPAGTMKSTAQISKDLGGHFQTGHIKGTGSGMAFEGRFHTTYDAAKKQFVMLWVDNMGAWAQNTSSGWKGDVMVFEGEGHMAGQTMKSRDTFTKSGAKSMKHTWEVEANGKWMPAGEETCTKK